MFSSTTRKICWFTLNSLFSPSSSSSSADERQEEKAQACCLKAKDPPPPLTPSDPDLGPRKRKGEGGFLSYISLSRSTYYGNDVMPTQPPATTTMGAIKCCEPEVKSPAAAAPVRNGCCKCEMPSDTASLSSLSKKVLSFQDAPFYLRFNPYITGGYRSSLSPRECIKSLFWWTNETINIWTHLTGWFFFLGLSVYDALGLLDLPTSHPWDQTVITLLLVCFQACMLLSSLYHIFCCHSEKFYRRWLSADLLGVSLSLLAIYISGIYYAFSCVPFWLNFYLVTVGAIFATAMGMQILPMLSRKDMVTEENFQLRLLVFGGWAAYGVIPTFHWALIHGGMSSPVVALLLPRIFGMYGISAAAFFFYVARLPERLWPGLVNFIGSSHQLWHILIVVALYHWHNTGLLYLQFRATHPCSEEYAFLFPNEAEVLE